jgi:hypothetical protein
VRRAPRRRRRRPDAVRRVRHRPRPLRRHRPRARPRPHRALALFAMGFDTAGRPLFPGFIITPADRSPAATSRSARPMGRAASSSAGRSTRRIRPSWTGCSSPGSTEQGSRCGRRPSSCRRVFWRCRRSPRRSWTGAGASSPPGSSRSPATRTATSRACSISTPTAARPCPPAGCASIPPAASPARRSWRGGARRRRWARPAGRARAAGRARPAAPAAALSPSPSPRRHGPISFSGTARAPGATPAGCRCRGSPGCAPATSRSPSRPTARSGSPGSRPTASCSIA